MKLNIKGGKTGSSTKVFIEVWPEGIYYFRVWSIEDDWSGIATSLDDAMEQVKNRALKMMNGVQ